MKIIRSIDEFERTYFPKGYEHKRRAKLSPRDLCREDVDKSLEKAKKGY